MVGKIWPASDRFVVIMTTILKLGTRRSLLAWAQSSWVAREVEKLNPGVRVELQGIETRGDRIQDVSLQSVDGKEFFVAELDHALRSKEVDFTVHSMKDLSLDRPEDFLCAAIPLRENPRDVILFGPRAISHAQSGRALKIGTSSPRRVENIPGFLKRAFPKIAATDSGRPQIDFVEIRGNVNTRLSRVHELSESPKYLDGVVLAFAGLIRLWNDPAGRAELSQLLQGIRWMVLPLKECPAAPAQGALAIECRARDEKVIALLRKMHDESSARRVAAERQLLADWGGGCHQRFGATAIDSPELGRVRFVRGVKSDGMQVDELNWQAPTHEVKTDEIRSWDGSLWRPSSMTSLEVKVEMENKSLFIAHSRAVESQNSTSFEQARVWTSGTASWYRLADRGIWVEGCAESMGFDLLESTLREPVLGLSGLGEWVVLTHEDARKEWELKGMRAVASYKVNSEYGNDAKTALKAAEFVFWSSGSQFDGLKGCVNSQVKHACGPGKTAAKLRESGIRVEVFPSAEEWRKWLKSIQ